MKPDKILGPQFRAPEVGSTKIVKFDAGEGVPIYMPGRIGAVHRLSLDQRRERRRKNKARRLKTSQSLRKPHGRQ